MFKNNPNRALLTVLLSICLFDAARAGPVGPSDPGDAADQPAATAVTGPANKPLSVDDSSSSRAVDLLIDLQSRSAGLDFKERARETASVPRPVLTPGPSTDQQPVGATGATQSAAGLFGSGAVPTPVVKESSAREADWQSSARRVSAGASPQESGRNGGSESAAGGMLKLPREIIQWVRENRSLVVGGALVLLALVWVSSVAMARRRR